MIYNNMSTKNKDTNYIEVFWKNIKEYSKDLDVLLENFKYSFLNDFIDNPQKWKTDLEILNDNLYDHYRYMGCNIIKDEVKISFDKFIKYFLEIGESFIIINKRLLATDMENIINTIIEKHMTDLNILIPQPKPELPLEESILTIKAFY